MKPAIIPGEQAERVLNAVDKNRATYLKYYTDQVFGKAVKLPSLHRQRENWDR